MTYGLEFKNRFSEKCVGLHPRETVHQQSLELVEIENLNEDSVVLDLGANHGDFLGAVAPTGCTIYAFEPHPMFYSKILESYKHFDNITFHNKAAWIKNETRKFYFKNASSV